MVYIKIEMGLGSRRRTPSAHADTTAAVTFAEREAQRMRTAGRHKTAANYLTAVRSLTRFLGRADWRFGALDTATLDGYQRWLCQQGLCLNTISAYMRSLRALYNRATAGAPEGGASPFGGVYTGREHTAKRSATADDLRRLLALSLAPGSPLCLARDLFVFSFCAMGMPFADMARLSSSHIHGGVIHYARQKTAQKVSVAIEPCMRGIIDRYRAPGSELIFPMLRHAAPCDVPRAYASSLRAYNRALHRLSQLAGCSQPLSSYVARHSWASLAYSRSVDLRLIAKAMGHTKLSTTLIYIRSLLDPSLADANRSVIESIGL